MKTVSEGFPFRFQFKFIPQRRACIISTYNRLSASFERVALSSYLFVEGDIFHCRKRKGRFEILIELWSEYQRLVCQDEFGRVRQIVKIQTVTVSTSALICKQIPPQSMTLSVYRVLRCNN